MIATGLGEISPGNNAEPRTKRLQQNRHQIRKQNDAEQHVAKLGTAGEVGRPISRIHVTDGDEITRAGEREQLSPKAGVARDRDTAMHFRQTRPRPLGPPSARNLLLHLLSVLKICSRASGKRLAGDAAGRALSYTISLLRQHSFELPVRPAIEWVGSIRVSREI